ncbi:CBS domain-containing protein [Alphaproteobacteria bacterium LSUCC0396]
MNNLIIRSSDSIRVALNKIQDNKKRFLICLDDNNTILGLATDGDIRRGFLLGLHMDDSVQKLININFDYLTVFSTFDEICEKFKSNKIDLLPIIDSDMKLVNIITKKQFHILLLEGIELDLTYDFTQLDKIALEHEIYNRPWGFYKSTILTSRAQAKIITVFPGGELSLQKHKKREEHWVVIYGNGKAILGESLFDIYPGKYIYVPKGCKHKIINESELNLIISEVQLGEYFGEDDIIRYSDKYGRK